MPEPHLRAADADRSAVADVLGVHMSAGRLTVEEYDDRLARAWSARTYGELAELTTDLPAVAAGTGRRPAEPVTGPAWAHGWYGSFGPRAGAPSLRAAWGSWATTALIVIGIWVMTMIGSQDWLYPWPVWVIGPWGAVLLVQTLGDRGRDADGRAQVSGRG